MNELVEKNQQGLAISDDTKALIVSGVSKTLCESIDSGQGRLKSG